MRGDEVRGVSALARLTLRGGTTRIHEFHQGIADRAFDAVGPVGAPVRAAHDAIAGLAYGSVRLALGAGARAAGAVAAVRADGTALGDAPAGRTALAILNGAHGDLVRREAPALDLGMTVRVDGRAVLLDPDALARAYPGATGRLAVFLHGLTHSEHSWGYRAERLHGSPGVTYGTKLRADLGLTPVYLRYNTGLHISDNGRDLDALGPAEHTHVPLHDGARH